MDIIIIIAFLALYYILGAWNSDCFENRNRRGCKTRRCGLPDGCGIPNTAICGVFRLDCAEDSEVRKYEKI